MAYIDSVSNNLKYVTDTGPQGADVQVTQTRQPAVILVGLQVQYTVTVINLGTDTATNVVLTDVLPAGSTFISATNGAPDPLHPGQVCWEIGDLLKGESRVTTITVQAPSSKGTMTNLASADSAASQDFKSANNQVSVSDPVTVPMHPLELTVVGDSGGTLSPQNPQPAYEEGSIVPVIATPDPGNCIGGWSGTVDDTSTSPTNSVKIGSGAKTTVSVTFKKITWQLTAMAVGGHGTINPNAGLYEDGTIVTVTARPDRHYGVKTWTGTDHDGGDGLINTVTMHKNCTVTVEFKEVPNQAPVAVLVLPSIVHPGDQVTLDGSTSFDPDTDPITYKWQETDVERVTLTDATSAKATFTAPDVPSGQEELTLSFRLTVTDDSNLSGANDGTIRVVPASPIDPPPCDKPCGCGVGAANLIGFYVLCWAGLACMKWAPRTSRRSR